MKLALQASVIVADNVVRQGEVANANSIDESVTGVRQPNERRYKKIKQRD